MPKYISGRSKKTPQSALPADRYRYLSVGDAEPNLGDSPGVAGSPNLPVGQQYIVVSFIDKPGERFWIPNQGGLIPGSFSIFDEGTLVGGLSSTTQLNFVGQSITAAGFGTGTSNPGVAVTLTVAPPGNLNEVLFVGAGGTDFATDTRFTFNNGLFAAGDRITVGTGGTVITTTGIGSVGIGTTEPTQKLHLDGNFRITGTIYDSTNQPGNNGDLITKTATGSLLWISPDSTITGAGGTIGQIQFHSSAGLVDGADNFYYDFNNNRVGIGSTQPTQLLDVLGVSTFSGGVFVDTFSVSGNSIFTGLIDANGGIDATTLNVSGLSTFGSNVDINASVDISTNLDVDGTTDLDVLNVSETASFTNTTDNTLGNTNTGGVQIDGGVGIDKNLTVGQTIQATNLNITGVGTIATFDFGVGQFDNIEVLGVSTLGNVVVNTNTISTKSGAGNLILDSDGSVQINDPLNVTGATESISKDSGSIITEGGIGVEKSVFIGLNLDVDGNTELDTLNVSVASTTASLTVGTGVAVTTILDEDDMSSDSNTALATQQSIKKYVDDQITSEDLDFAGDTGSGSVDLDSQTFTIAGTTNEIETSGSNQTLTIGLPDDVTVSGNLTVNGNTTLGDTDADNIVFNAEVDSNIIPDDNNTYNLGSSGKKWSTVFATTFNGAFQGNADSADKLSTPRTISFGGDVVAIGKTFDGTQNVGFALTLTDTGVSDGNYGSATQVATFSVDTDGRLTAASNVNINFAGATVDKASYADNAGIATNLKGGTAYQIPYQSAANTTQFISNGSVTGQLLQYNQSSAPSWVSVGDITAGTASTANNLAGGAAGSIPYQSAPGTTAFLAEPDADNKILSYDNSSDTPVWIDASSVGTDTFVTGAGFSSITGGTRLTLTRNQSQPNITADLTLSGIGGTDKFTGLTDTPANYSGSGGKVVTVNSGASGLEFTDVDAVGTDNYVNSVSFGSGTLTLGRTGSLPNLTTTINLAGIGGTDKFTGLTDTPSNYSGDGGKIVGVNSTADGLEFINASTIAGTTYTLPAGGSSSAVTMTLTGSDSTTDIVTISAGTGITFGSISASGFTINSTGIGSTGGSSDPVGTIVAWAGSAATIPSDYQLCDGGAASTSALQAITGSNVPDLRNRFIVGASNSTGDNTYPGLSPNATPGGSANAVVVEHNHGTTGGTFVTGVTLNKNTNEIPNSPDEINVLNNNTSISVATGSVSIDNEGVSATNANLPPYYALCYIIKHTATSGSGGGTGTLTDVDVKQYANDNNPRTEYS